MTSENEDVQSPDEKSPSRKERERERHRLEVLDAAERAFARDGYHGTTVESIAKEAEFAVGTLYNFFSGKDELYAAVLYRIAGDLLEEFEREALSKDDPVEAVAAVFDLRVRLLEEHQAFFRLMFEAGPGHSGEMHANMRRMLERYLKALSGLFERGMQKGAFRKGDPVFTAMCLEGICHAMMLYTTLHTPTTPIAELAQRAKAAFLEQIRVRTPGDAGA